MNKLFYLQNACLELHRNMAIADTMTVIKTFDDRWSAFLTDLHSTHLGSRGSLSWMVNRTERTVAGEA